ncbi:NnrU family protein [Alsobacter sp. KACC 23698]|uniref:NnrU family protein n=1 Tax=Alsobacter sp. KACC 23698 TaxID=3149229 RepID=A0AAU7JMW4_9HYPH
MTQFLAALGAFLLAHLVPSAPGVRPWLIARVGRPAYLAGYSVLSLALLAWVVRAGLAAEPVVLWEPAAWQWMVPFVAMPISLVLILAGLAAPNPLSISLRAGGKAPAIASVTRHPVLWGFLLWAAAHIPPNGRLVPAVTFGAMAALSAAGFALLDRKSRLRLGEARWTALAGRTSILPFAALLGGRAPAARWGELGPPAAAALLVYAWFVVQGHALLIGRDPLAGLLAWF